MEEKVASHADLSTNSSHSQRQVYPPPKISSSCCSRVHVPGDVHLRDALHQVFLLSCTWELENGVSESDPRREEREASIRKPSVLLVSKLVYLIWTDYAIANDRSAPWNSLVDMYANVFE